MNIKKIKSLLLEGEKTPQPKNALLQIKFCNMFTEEAKTEHNNDLYDRDRLWVMFCSGLLTIEEAIHIAKRLDKNSRFIKTYLTLGGNILLHNLKENYSFHRPDLSLIRQVSQEEGIYLSSIALPIRFETMLHSKFTGYAIGITKFPVWNFIISIEIEQDYSNYKWGTCNNGGDYSFTTHQDWFVCQFEDKWRFAYVEWKSTSAEFSYDELAGQFRQNLATISPMNVGESRYYLTQTRSGYEEMEVLEAIQGFQESSFRQLWLSECLYIPERDSEEEEDTYPALSLVQKKQLLTQLKELGWSKSSSKGGRSKGSRRR